MAKTNYWKADSVREVAEKLIPQFHKEIDDFKVRVDYWFTDKVTKRNGKEVWGLCRKVSGFNAAQAFDNPECEEFYAIIIPEVIWTALSDKGKTALVDHELCHVLVEYDADEEGDASADAVKKKIAPHDMEEFLCINRRYGNWQDAEMDAINAVIKPVEHTEDEIEDE
jgi:hypothetical protein